MKIKLPKMIGKSVLHTNTFLINQGQKYLITLENKKSSSIKKMISSVLLIPIIVPTTVTLLTLGFTILFIKSVSNQENDSVLSKITKGIIRFFIYILAIPILIPCIIINLAVSLIPGLIFLAINKNSVDKENVNIEENSQHRKEDLQIKEFRKSNEEYNAQFNDFGNYDQDKSQSDTQTTPDIQVISNILEGNNNKEKSIIIKNINNGDIENGECTIHKTTTNNSISCKGILAYKDLKEGFGFASAINFECTSTQDGLDLQFSLAARTGETKKEAVQAVKKSQVVKSMLTHIEETQAPGKSITQAILDR